MEEKNSSSEKFEIGEDCTQYGEFISSYFAWVPLNVQKQKVEKLENIERNETTEKNKSNRKGQKR